jgi:hypothetical protein
MVQTTQRGALDSKIKILTSKIGFNAKQGDQPPEALTYLAKALRGTSKIVLDERL